MNTILILEDLADTRTWLCDMTQRVFPKAKLLPCARVKQAQEVIALQGIDLALVDLGLPDGHGTAVVRHLHQTQPNARAVVVSIHDDDEHLFPALQAGAFGYILKEQPEQQTAEQLQRIGQGQPPLSPRIARRMFRHFQDMPQPAASPTPNVQLTERETEVLLRVAKGFTLPEIGVQLGLSRHTIADYVKQIYRKLNISSRAEAALEAQRLGVFRS